MDPRLELAGGLDIESDAGLLHVAFRGDVVALELPDLKSARRLGRLMRRGPRRAWLRRTDHMLAQAGIVLQVWVASRQVGRLGAGTRPSRLARWLGLDPLELIWRRNEGSR